jgi:hypothetical protein
MGIRAGDEAVDSEKRRCWGEAVFEEKGGAVRKMERWQNPRRCQATAPRKKRLLECSGLRQTNSPGRKEEHGEDGEGLVPYRLNPA